MRRIMKRGKDGRIFRKTALQTKSINTASTVRRGGIRL